MSKVICICPTHRDHRELAALASGHTFLHHDYASALEDLSGRMSEQREHQRPGTGNRNDSETLPRRTHSRSHHDR